MSQKNDKKKRITTLFLSSFCYVVREYFLVFSRTIWLLLIVHKMPEHFHLVSCCFGSTYDGLLLIIEKTNIIKDFF